MVFGFKVSIYYHKKSIYIYIYIYIIYITIFNLHNKIIIFQSQGFLGWVWSARLSEIVVATLYLGMTLVGFFLLLFFLFIFFYFEGFMGSETPIKHAQDLKLMAELNSTPGDSPRSVNN